MMKLFIASGNELLVAEKRTGEWSLVSRSLPKGDIQAVAAEPQGGAVFAGTLDHGLWYSTNEGESWEQIGKDVLHNRVMALHVTSYKGTDRDEETRLYVGTEPSELYCTTNYGQTWERFPSLLTLPSKSTWSFPPRPYTHHVRDIATSKKDKNFILAGIELGGVMRSLDGGKSFEDRKEGSQFDCHTIKVHPENDQLIYEAGGGGFAESRDKGNTWNTHNDGLGEFTYLVHVAVDPGDSELVVVSAAEGPMTAYSPSRAHTHIYRREKTGGVWSRVSDGLPDPTHSTVYHLHSNPNEPHCFYAVNNNGIYCSDDKGKTWSEAPVQWPESVHHKRITDVWLQSE